MSLNRLRNINQDCVRLRGREERRRMKYQYTPPSERHSKLERESVAEIKDRFLFRTPDVCVDGVVSMPCEGRLPLLPERVVESASRQ